MEFINEYSCIFGAIYNVAAPAIVAKSNKIKRMFFFLKKDSFSLNRFIKALLPIRISGEIMHHTIWEKINPARMAHPARI